MLTSAFATIRGENNSLGLPKANRSVVVLVDGLGAENLQVHRAHARTLTSLTSAPIFANFPSTTASSLATLCTGSSPGETGMVGYAIRNPRSGEIVNQLSGLDALDVDQWQPVPTVWEANPDIANAIISAERYATTGLTRAILRGGNYRSANTYEQRVACLHEFFRGHSSGVAYIYVPELDQAAHQFGVASDQWVRRLEDFDGFIADILRVLGPRDGLLVTADHGVLDVPSVKHRIVPASSELLDDVVTGGEPRFLHLYSSRNPDELASAWREAEGERAHVVTRTEGIAAGWFGAVNTEHLDRIGDVLVTPRGTAVYYDERTATTQSMAMIGQHGGLSRTETHVPLIRGGAFG